MNAPRFEIVDDGPGKHIVRNAHVYLVREDGDGNEERIEVSHLVRRIRVDLDFGKIALADLSVFISRFESKVEASTILADYLRQPSLWKRFRLWAFGSRLRDVTTFNPEGKQEFYP